MIGNALYINWGEFKRTYDVSLPIEPADFEGSIVLFEVTRIAHFY